MPIFFKPSASDFSLSADSIGNRWLQEPVVRPNGFPLYHWIQTERGEGLLTLEGQKLLLKPGDGVLIAPHVPHEYRENDGSGMWFTSFLTFDGKELYPTKEEKAARIGYSLISNHAFVDGNKRIGMYVLLSFLEVNGIKIRPSNEEVVRVGLATAAGEMKYEDILAWILENE